MIVMDGRAFVRGWKQDEIGGATQHATRHSRRDFARPPAACASAYESTTIDPDSAGRYLRRFL